MVLSIGRPTIVTICGTNCGTFVSKTKLHEIENIYLDRWGLDKIEFARLTFAQAKLVN